MFDLDRFISAHARNVDGYNTALNELTAGHKRSHWIWYIFPQLAGLGNSPMAAHYGLDGIEEALAYLRHPTLRSHFLLLTDVLVRQLQHRPTPRLSELMGSELDTLKLISSMTLFRKVAHRLRSVEPRADDRRIEANASTILGVAAQQGLGACATTLAAVSK